MSDNNNNIDNIDIDLLLMRLETNYPAGYDFNVLRDAAKVIRFYMEEGK